MPWFKVDDKLHDHRKARDAGKSAMGLWVLAASWCSSQGSDGFVPQRVARRWGTDSDVRRLLRASLWVEDTLDGEAGYRFHDWSDFQPTAAVTAAKLAAERDAGLRGNHRRWHVARKINDPHCEYCDRVPDKEPDAEPIGPYESGPNRPYPYPISTTSNEVVRLSETRDDVTRICEHLAAAVAENGSKRPTISKAWRDEVRRMLDIDKRSELEVIKAIDWCQRGDSERATFWRSNVMSPQKLRAKFDVMRLQAAQENNGKQQQQGRTQQWLTLAAELAPDDPTTIQQIGPIR